jgi:hypothetical protein
MQHIDDIRRSPWLAPLRLKVLALVLVSVGVGIAMGRMTSKSIVVIPDRPPTAEELAALRAWPPAPDDGQVATAAVPRSELSQAKNVTPPLALNPSTEGHRPPAPVIRSQEPEPSGHVTRDRAESRKSTRDYRELRDYMLKR